MRSRVLALAVAFVALAVAYPSPPIAAGFCVLVAVVPLILGARFEVDRVAQAAVAIGAMMAGILVARASSSPVEGPLLLSERTLLLGLPMLAVAGARACLVRPIYGEKLTLLAALVALTAAGRSQTGVVFPTLAALATASGLLALRTADPSRASLRHLEARHFVGMVFGASMAAGLAYFATWSLPRVHDAMIARIMARAERNRTGFADRMMLGSMSGMLQSDSVVMRVRGPAPPLLRGVVLVNYQGGQWESSIEASVPEVVETPTEPHGQPIEIEHSGRLPRYFVPLGVQDVTSSSGYLERYENGLMSSPTREAFAKRLWLREGDQPDKPPPRLEELHVPRRLMPELTRTLHKWGAEGLPPREALELLSQRLARDYRYSLDFDRDPTADPILDFLNTHKEGHCEYFASAFALLARAARIPARVIAGYRVMETSPLGYFIVRERNAHSWVEVWLDGRWVTFDPTPASEMNAATPISTPWIGALFDGLRTAWEAADDWLERRTAFELSLVLVTLLGTLVLVRAFRGRAQNKTVKDFDVPRELEALVRALRRVGIERAPHETLGTLARRVRDADQLRDEVRSEVAAALVRYERFRYGDDRDDDALVGLERATAQVAT